MNDDVVDITPQHDPVGLARGMEKEAQEKKCVAGFYMLLAEDGTVTYDGCAHKQQELLWALERLKADVLR